MSPVFALLVETALSGFPKSDEERCNLIAKSAVRAYGAPKTEFGMFSGAVALAKGAFANDWDRMPEDRRWTCIDYCERALREAARAPP